MVKEKTNYTFALLTIVAIIAIVAIVIMYIQSKGTTYTAAEPEIQQAIPLEAENIAGKANWAAYCQIYAERFNRYMDTNPDLAMAYREAYYGNNCEGRLG